MLNPTTPFLQQQGALILDPGLATELERRGLMTRFETTPDVRYSEIENFADGSTGMSKWLLTGTNLQGEKMSVRGCDFYTFEDGKVIRKDSYWKIVV